MLTGARQVEWRSATQWNHVHMWSYIARILYILFGRSIAPHSQHCARSGRWENVIMITHYRLNGFACVRSLAHSHPTKKRSLRWLYSAERMLCTANRLCATSTILRAHASTIDWTFRISLDCTFPPEAHAQTTIFHLDAIHLINSKWLAHMQPGRPNAASNGNSALASELNVAFRCHIITKLPFHTFECLLAANSHVCAISSQLKSSPQFFSATRTPWISHAPTVHRFRRNNTAQRHFSSHAKLAEMLVILSFPFSLAPALSNFRINCIICFRFPFAKRWNYVGFKQHACRQRPTAQCDVCVQQ